MGMATKYIRANMTKDSLDWFKGNLTNLIDLIKSLSYDFKYYNTQAKTSSSSSSSSSNSNNSPNTNNNLNNNFNLMSSSFYWMLQDPIDESKYLFNKSITDQQITNRQIDLYNRASIDILYSSPVNIWSSSRLVSQAFNKDSTDGLHIGPFALEIVFTLLFYF